ncbi:hypothetical protein GCM10009854_05050 [Saccharopolyspora halophila]|uniref:Outer membrane channel protein CpnT-like N-terminal domain-containing protein n=1 Tax=Saccharopolyspora halophila TaxID=405551 RepID=A0ABP5SJM8_9PSEU
MEMKVAPEALAAHSTGSEGVAEHLQQLSQLLEQARVSDDCFGPIGEFLAFTYFDSLEECRDLANRAGGFMRHISEAVQESAKHYRETDQGQADQLGGIDLAGLSGAGGGPGSLAAVNGAGSQKGFMAQTAGYGMSSVSASQGLAKASSPPDVAIATVNARMEQLELVTSPGQSFVDNGLGFLVSLVISPLVEFVLEPAIGDPEQMRSTGKGWEQVADWLEKLGEHEQQRAEATRPVWEGRAGDAFREQMGEFTEGTSAFASDVRDLKQTLDLAADIFDTFVETCIDIIQELVIGLIIEWIAALAASWITAGASVATAQGATAAQAAITGTRLGTKVAELVHKLRPLVTKLEDLLQKLRTSHLSKLVDKMNELRDGNMAQQWVARQVDANPLAKTLTRGGGHDIKKAEEAVEAAQKRVDLGEAGAAERLRNAQRDLADVQADPSYATTTGNRYAQQVRDGWSGDLEAEPGESAVGEQALAANLTQAGLGQLGLSGEHRWQDAVIHQGSANVLHEGVEQGVKYGYDEAADPSTEEERRAAEERGFGV